MKPRSLAVLGLLLYCSLTWAQTPAPKPWKPKGGTAPPAARSGKKAVNLINGVPDTGQFLPDSAVLGSIDGRKFTVLEFRDRWYAAYPPDRPKTDSAGRAEFLNSMANKEVLADLAWRVNRPLGFEDRTQLREARQVWLANAAFARLVADSAQPTEAEIQHAIEQRKWALHLQHVVNPSLPVAERARAEVVAGKLPWAEAVKRTSTSHSDKGPDGDVGWVQRKVFPPSIAEEIYDLKVGEVSRVFEGDSGFEFVRVVERRNENYAIEAVRSLVVNETRALKAMHRMEQVRSQIRERIGMVYDTTNIAWAASVFDADEKQRARAAAAEKSIDLSDVLPEFQPADTARVLARWKGGQYTLREFLEAFNAVAVPQRGKIGSFGAFRWRLDGFALEPFMAQLAEERGYDKDSLVIRELRKKEEQIRVEHLFADSVQSRVNITSAMRKKFYAEHGPDYRSFENVTYAIILRHSKAGADSLVARLKAGTDPLVVIREDSTAGHPSGSIKSMREDDHDSFHKIVFEEMKPGDVSSVGPDKQGDYAVFKVLTHDASRQMAYTEVEGLIDDALQNIEAERLLKAFIARHRVGHKIDLHPELLMRVRLTDPTLDS